QAKITGADQEAQRIIAGAQRYADQLLSEAEAIYTQNLAEIIKGRKEIDNVLMKIARSNGNYDFKAI
ncbi:MAG: hypothetical protein ACOWWO_12555, partial [Peptococcaceae bacterium]